MDINKILPPSKVNPIKLLGGTSFVSSNKEILTEPKNNLLGIKKQVDQIKNLVTNLTTLKKKSIKSKRKEEEQERFAEKEKKLEEKKKPGDNNKIKMPNFPKLGFLDVIKRFIVNTLFGYIAVRLIDHLPKLIGVAGLLGNALDFITDFGGKILNGLATFIQKGYEAYDFTRNTLKSFGGDNALKLFDGFNKALDGVILAALAASFALVDLAKEENEGVKKGRRGFDTKGRRVSTSGQRRFAERYGRDEFIKRFGKENLKNLPKSMQRGALTKLGRNALVGTLGKGGVKTAIRILKPLTRGIPVIGGLVEFGLSLLDGDNVGKAAFKAVGATLFGAIGAALGGPFALFTGIGGSMLGSFAAEKLYDFIFKGKSTSPSAVKAAGGGQTPVTRGGKLVGGAPKRKIKKSKKRTINVQPTPIKPGSSVGGEKKIETVFPQSDNKNVVNPLGYIKSSYSKISKEPFFGSLMGISMKSLVGQKPSKVDYRNAAQGLNNWMNVTFSDEILRTGSLYAAGGGEVNAEMLSRMGGDMTDVIAKSLEESISKKVDDAINDLMKQMMLKPPEKKETKETPEEYDEYDGDLSGEGMDVAYKIYRKLISDGIPAAAAAGIVGNIGAESNFDPAAIEGGTGIGRGWIQWSYGRRTAFENWSKRNNLNPDSTEANYGYLLYEMKGNDGNHWMPRPDTPQNLRVNNLREYIEKSTDPETAAKLFMYNYERPRADVQHLDKRINYSMQVSKMKPPGPIDTGYNIPRGKQRKGFPTGYPPNRPGPFDVIEYITGDRRHSNFELKGHGTPANYHDHIAFSSVANKERAKRALIASNIKIGSELRPGDKGYHGINLAIDVPGDQWSGSGAIGEKEFAGSRKVRKVLGLREGGYIEPIRNKRNAKSLQSFSSYDNSSNQVIYVKLPKPTVVTVPMPIPMGSGSGGFISNYSFDDKQELYTHT